MCQHFQSFFPRRNQTLSFASSSFHDTPPWTHHPTPWQSEVVARGFILSDNGVGGTQTRGNVPRVGQERGQARRGQDPAQQV